MVGAMRAAFWRAAWRPSASPAASFALFCFGDLLWPVSTPPSPRCLSLRRDRHGQRRLQAQGDLAGAGRRHRGRHHRARRRDLSPRTVAAASVRRDLHRRSRCWPLLAVVVVTQLTFAAAAAARQSQPGRGRPLRRSLAAAVHRRGGLRRRQLRDDEPRDDLGADRDGRLRPFGHDATLGIQWHVLAMYAPSFFTGR